MQASFSFIHPSASLCVCGSENLTLCLFPSSFSSPPPLIPTLKAYHFYILTDDLVSLSLCLSRAVCIVHLEQNSTLLVIKQCLWWSCYFPLGIICLTLFLLAFLALYDVRCGRKSLPSSLSPIVHFSMLQVRYLSLKTSIRKYAAGPTEGFKYAQGSAEEVARPS